MDFRVSRSSVEGLDEAHFFWALIEPVWPDSSVVDELRHIARATPGQRALYVVTLFVREVDNGGLDQFFSNSSGMYAADVLTALRLLEAHDQACALEQALTAFFGGWAPVDRMDRIRALNAIPKQRREELFRPLEERLLGEERLWPFFRRYVAAHPSEFFKDEGSA